MNVKQLLSDEDAVSPVIGVILMVAITVILAAVIGTFVLGLGDQVQSSAPNSNFQFEYPNDTYDGTVQNGILVTHNGGQDVERSNMELQVGSTEITSLTDGDAGVTTNGGWPETVATGDTLYLNEGAANDDFAAGETVRVVWQSDSGGSSNTIGESTVPS